MKVIIETNGKVVHHGDIGIDRVFRRSIDTGAIMKIYDAISINPLALPAVIENADNIEFNISGTVYRISVDDALEYGFTKTHGGEKKLYIQRKYWTIVK